MAAPVGDPLLDDGPVRVLIVDDLPEKLLVLAAVLEELGQSVVTARSGRDALRELLQNDFAVILLDVNMPGLDGFETAELIRAHPRSAHVPIIFVTAFADEIQTARGYALGAVDYILAPVQPEVLRSKVRVFVALHELRRQAARAVEDRNAVRIAEAAREAAEREQRRVGFLSNAGRELGGSLDVQVCAERLARLVVPHLADRLVVVLSDEAGAPERCLRAEPESASGEVQVHPVAPEAIDPPVAGVLPSVLSDRRARRDSTLSGVPLLAGERLLGAMVALHESEADEADRGLIEELAALAAAALEKALLHENLRREVEERRAIEVKLQAANRRKDEFLAMLSHELRNPLAAICTSLEVVRRLDVAEPRLSWAAEIMDRQSRHMTRLIEELLDVARISQDKIVLERSRIDLVEVIATAAESAQPQIDARQQTLAVARPDEPVWLHGDAARLAQVVGNLLHNASKFSGKGTRIELHCSVDEAGALIVVRDQGVGIEPELLPRIFDLFAQGVRGLDRAQGGLGVGLTLAQRLAQLHGGHIEAASDGPDRGAEFRVRLPCLWLARRDGDAVPPGTAQSPTPTRRVLVVDDNADAARSLATLLELSARHVVRTAGDGEAALRVAAEFVPEVVVLDIGLPLLDGYEVARRLREDGRTRGALIIALTGYGQSHDRRLAREAGFDHHFVKPAGLPELSACIADWRPAAAARSA